MVQQLVAHLLCELRMRGMKKLCIVMVLMFVSFNFLLFSASRVPHVEDVKQLEAQSNELGERIAKLLGASDFNFNAANISQIQEISVNVDR